MRRRHRNRRGATLVEMAIIGPLTFMLLIGMLVGSMGVFRSQQVARLARDATRWASVHGTDYAKDTKNTAATSTDVYNTAIKPYAAGLDLSKLTYSVTWTTSNSPSHSATINSQTVNVANTVTVTIHYQWLPEAYFGGITLSSTSVAVMTY
jgi:Flp pilus assembly protein TadG